MSRYNDIRTNVVGLAFDELRFLRLTGSDTIEYLHRMVTQDIRTMAPHDARAACLCTHKGKLVGHLLIVRWDDQVILVTPATHFEAVFFQLEKYVIVDDVVLEDASDDWKLLSVQGPKSEEIIREHFAVANPEFTKNFETSLVALDNDAQIIGFEHTRTGERGIDLLVPKPQFEKVVKTLEDAIGALENEHDQAFNRARIEAGIPAANTELTDAIIPVEAALQHTISYTKGCYAGQEVIAKIKYLGEPPKTLLSLTADMESFSNEANIELQNGGKTLGTVTSWFRVPESQQVVLLGFIKTRMIPKIETIDLFADGEVLGTTTVSIDPVVWGSGFELI